MAGMNDPSDQDVERKRGPVNSAAADAGVDMTTPPGFPPRRTGGAKKTSRKRADQAEPQRVWAVYENGRRGPELRSAEVVRTTAKRVYIANRPLAFDCVVSIDRSIACFTPDDALTAWRAKCDERIVALEDQLAEAVAMRLAEVKS